MDHGSMDHGSSDMGGMDHGGMDHGGDSGCLVSVRPTHPPPSLQRAEKKPKS